MAYDAFVPLPPVPSLHRSPGPMRALFRVLFCALLVSGPLDGANAAEAPGDVDAVLADLTRDRLFSQAKVGLKVVQVRTGEAIFDVNAGDGLHPASTMKVVTAAAALKHLGPSYTFETEVLVDGERGRDGVIQGDLMVRGGGDPHFVVERMWKLVRDLALHGVTSIDGDVVFDGSFFDTEYRLPGWGKKKDIERGPAYFASLSALSLNFNTVSVVVRPGVKVGEPAVVGLETPADGYVALVNEAKTGSKGSRRAIGIQREVLDGSMAFRVTGSIAVDGSMRRYYRSVEDPTAHFMAAWMEMLAEQGITVSGAARRGEVTDTATSLVRHTSPPLAAILMDMNKYSNNFMAEQVLKTLGAEVKGAPGTTDKGLEVVADYLEAIGVARDDVILINGSGLTRQARLSPDVLTAVLVDMASDGAVGHEFHASLAIAGLDGTLMRRLTEEPGRLRGKTGTIDGVHCLAGYVDDKYGEQYAFAFMVNDHGGSVSQVKRLHDRFARKMFEMGGDSESGPN
jgi:serine-type D-Ala-D-Ala carboxypeptidase/endopeptidase (penicillin-binding protein 4)